MLSCVYGAFQVESSLEAMVRNKWLRDVIFSEREYEFYKTHYLASTIIMTYTGKSETVLDMHKRLAGLCYPWNEPEEDKTASQEGAVQRFKAMQESGTIDGMKRDVSVNEIFEKWRDPLLDEEPK